jgi:hypothetical protein
LTSKGKVLDDPHQQNAITAAATFPARIDEAKNEVYCTAVTISHIEGDADVEEVFAYYPAYLVQDGI